MLFIRDERERITVQLSFNVDDLPATTVMTMVMAMLMPIALPIALTIALPISTVHLPKGWIRIASIVVIQLSAHGT